jgi:triacylglycerol lipase
MKGMQTGVLLLRYPVVLLHGLGALPLAGRRSHLVPIARFLCRHGIRAYAPVVAPYAPIAQRARFWQQHLQTILEATRASQAHLIAHSMGGLDARYLISCLEGYRYVATLITLSTPHQGSSLAYLLLQRPRISQRLLTQLAHRLSHWVLPEAPAALLETLECLTPAYVTEYFNPQVPNHPDVRYISWAGMAGPGTDVPITPCIAPLARYIYRHEGLNDGYVAVHSARWGRFMGTLPVDHLRQAGIRLGSGAPFDEKAFFLYLCRQLLVPIELSAVVD